MFKMREFADREAGRLTSKAKKVTANAKSSFAAVFILQAWVYLSTFVAKRRPVIDRTELS